MRLGRTPDTTVYDALAYRFFLVDYACILKGHRSDHITAVRWHVHCVGWVLRAATCRGAPNAVGRRGLRRAKYCDGSALHYVIRAGKSSGKRNQHRATAGMRRRQPPTFRNATECYLIELSEILNSTAACELD